MKYGKYAVLILLLSLFACSGGKDTANMTPDEHLKYAMMLYNDGDYEEAVKEFQSIILQYAGNPVNDDAQYYLGMAYFKQEQYLLAAYEFSKLIRDIPASPLVPDAQFMLADSYYELSPPYSLEQSYTKKAIDEFQAFIDYFPLDKRVDEAERKIKELNEKLAEKEFNAGLIYERMEYYNAAIMYYERVFETYHDSKFAPVALYRKIKLLIDKNKKPEALKDIATFLAKYSDSEYAKELEKLQNELIASK